MYERKDIPSMNPEQYLRRHIIPVLHNNMTGPHGHVGGWCEDCGNLYARLDEECPGRPRTPR